jgi:hypothetical protein
MNGILTGWLSNVLGALTKLLRFTPSPQIGFSISTSLTGYSKMDPNDFTLNRMIFTNESTIGELWTDNRFLCYSLEDTCRLQKIKGITAIPAGRYEIKMLPSPKFKQDMPHLLNIPNYTDVMLHWGNSPKDTNGCPLLGLSKGVDYIYESKAACAEVFPIINRKLSEGPLFISVLGGRSV